MSDVLATAAAPVELEQGPPGHLLRSEVRRLAHRRFVRWLVLLGLVIYLGILAIAWTQYAKTTPAELAKAEQRREQFAADQNSYLQQCVQQVPAGEEPESYCGPPMQPSDFGEVTDFLPHPAFTMADQLPGFSVGMAALAAVVGFLLAATAIGAEWSQKTMVALLFWEPRRLRVLATKVAVVTGALIAIAVVSQALLVPIGYAFGSVKGSTEVPAGFWSDLLAQQARCILLVVLVGLIGFGIAHLVRHTAAALGAAFVYFVAEIFAMNLRPQWQPWFLTTNAGALVSEGGLRVSWPQPQPTIGEGGMISTYSEHVITNLHGAAVIGGVAVVLLLVGGWVFKRRDLT